MSEHSLKQPFDALQRTFVLPQQTSQLPAAVTDNKVRGHAFNIGIFHLVVDTVKHPCEVYEELPLCRLPGSPAHLVGMANQRGNIVPVFDIQSLLGYRVEGKIRHYFLVIGARDEAIGFRIASLPKRVELSPEERVTTALPIPQLLEPHISHLYLQNEQLFADWDVRGFLTSFVSNP